MRYGRYCLDCGWDGSMGTRAAKRAEARQVAGEVAAVLGTVPPGPRPVPTPDECMHGCNGWPCNSEACRFWCHDGDGGRVA